MKLYKKIFLKINKKLYPSKYKSNTSVKPFKQLCVGDKIYVLTLPNLKYMSIYGRQMAMSFAFITTCKVEYVKYEKIGKTQFQTLSLNFQNYNGIIKKHMNSIILTNNILNAQLFIPTPKKTLYHFPTQTNDYIYLSTDKNDIIYYLKTFAQQIKNSLNTQEITTNNLYNWTITTNDKDIKEFKQQYNKIIYQLTLM